MAKKKTDDLTTSIAQRILEKVMVIRDSLPSMKRSTKKKAPSNKKVTKKKVAKTKAAKKIVRKKRK